MTLCQPPFCSSVICEHSCCRYRLPRYLLLTESDQLKVSGSTWALARSLAFSRASAEAALAAWARSAAIFWRPASRILLRSPLVRGVIGIGLGFLHQQGNLGFLGLGQILHFQLLHDALLRSLNAHPNTHPSETG